MRQDRHRLASQVEDEGGGLEDDDDGDHDDDDDGDNEEDVGE